MWALWYYLFNAVLYMALPIRVLDSCIAKA
jgi:hypothetical protein